MITLAAAAPERAEALRRLAAVEELELGTPQGSWVPAVLETADPSGAIATIEAVPGVRFVEVIFVEITAP